MIDPSKLQLDPAAKPMPKGWLPPGYVPRFPQKTRPPRTDSPPLKTRTPVATPTPKELPAPVACPYLGAERPAKLKCGCAANLLFPVHDCRHPDNQRTNRAGETHPRGALPTVGYRPSRSHVPPDLFTPCLFCQLKPEVTPHDQTR